jgi:peptide methionine sulfoxide reductase msrA/msrB
MTKTMLLLSIVALLSSSCNGQNNDSTISLNSTADMETAILASGCFWGTDYFLKQIDGVISTTVGYTGGFIENPTYAQVCSKQTGHYEAAHIVFDPGKTTYEAVVRVFFETHDPTQTNGQGPDIGPQYKSAIFYNSEAQKITAEKLIDLLKDKGLDIATELIAADVFYPAESYHQDYYDTKGGTPYCHGYRSLF